MLLFSNAHEGTAGLLCKAVLLCLIFSLQDCRYWPAFSTKRGPIRIGMKIRLPFSAFLELKIDHFFGTFVSYLQTSKPKCYSCKMLRSKYKLVLFFFFSFLWSSFLVDLWAKLKILIFLCVALAGAPNFKITVHWSIIKIGVWRTSLMFLKDFFFFSKRRVLVLRVFQFLPHPS